MGCFLGDAEEEDGSPSNPAEYQEDFYQAGTACPKDWYFLGTFEGKKYHLENHLPGRLIRIGFVIKKGLQCLACQLQK